MSKMKNELINDPLMPMRHSCEHVLHQAIVELYPGLKRAMGPATSEGFYTDFDYSKKITEADFPKIEEKMHEIVKRNLAIVREEISIEEAKKLFKGNEYKEDWIEQIKARGEKATVYWTGKKGEEGSDVDLCAGPHVESTGKVGAFKLLSVAGAYWHGDEKNKMLQRIYGTSFPTQKELEEYLNMLEEAKKRDHKKIGRELDLLMFHETAPGMPYWLPKGVILYNELVEFWRQEHKARGYQEITSPLINKKELYEISGHWSHYLEDMFVSETKDGEVYGLKPMNCPNAMIVFGYKTRSYRELPLRLGDTDCLHRNERSGTLNGLLRAREFRQDDAHIFVTPDQVKSEFKEVLAITERFYSIFNLPYRLRLGTRPEKFMGDKESWDKAEAQLKEVLEESKADYFILEGDGAFYGPKIDILMKDSLGRDWQMGTIQLDYQIPKNFDLKYIDEDGTLKMPLAIHRVIYGSLERFLGILIEQFAGAFPVWLAPVQVQVIPITDDQNEYAELLKQDLVAVDLRAEVDSRSETMQSKIRDAQQMKVPYMLIVGKNEQKNKTVSVRLRSGENLGELDLQEFKARALKIYKERSLDL